MAENKLATSASDGESPRFCHNCGASVGEDFQWCPKCGTKLLNNNIICPNCGTENPPDSNWCYKCGTKLRSPQSPGQADLTAQNRTTVESARGTSPHSAELDSTPSSTKPKVSLLKHKDKSGGIPPISNDALPQSDRPRVSLLKPQTKPNQTTTSQQATFPSSKENRPTKVPSAQANAQRQALIDAAGEHKVWIPQRFPKASRQQPVLQTALPAWDVLPGNN